MSNAVVIGNPVALITGAAKRIGAEVARFLHANNFNVVIHYRRSQNEAEQLVASLNRIRANSAVSFQADLTNTKEIELLVRHAVAYWARIDTLINNASSFYPTTIGKVTNNEWEDLMSSNVKAPFFLAQALASELIKNHGCIINMTDIYADKPLKNHSVYSMAKAANVMLTKSLALELAPNVRVNGIAPGAILWPENMGTEDSEKLSLLDKNNLLAKIPLQRIGEMDDIAKTILFLINDAPYINGQILTVDGGRNLII
ncbi:MAG: pteridine reductase [Pseudomonadota bacterium]